MTLMTKIKRKSQRTEKISAAETYLLAKSSLRVSNLKDSKIIRSVSVNAQMRGSMILQFRW